jgi:hypothetical protein
MGFAIGFGIVIHGQVLRGADYSAGEFQSILWVPGNTSQFSISDTMMAEPEMYPEARTSTIHELAAHVAFLANTLDLSLIVIGGGLEKYGTEPLSILQNEIEKNWSYPDQVKCELCMVKNGEYSVASGAASMYLERLFSFSPIPVEIDALPPHKLRGYELFQYLSSLEHLACKPKMIISSSLKPPATSILDIFGLFLPCPKDVGRSIFKCLIDE